MEYVQLKEICSINMGQSPDSKSYNNDGNGMPFYQGNADFGETHPVTRVWCTEPTKIAEKDDILLSVRAPIGALNIADETCCIGRGLAAITPNAKLATTTFIYWCLKCKNAELNSKGTGSTFKAINKKTLEETLIPKVSFAEQQYISETLQRVFSIITHRRQQLQELDELVKARFVEMFGDGKYPQTSIAELVSGKVPSVKKDFSPEDTIKYIDISSIDNKQNVMTGYTEYVVKEAPSRAQQHISKGDIVISTVRPNLRNVAITQYEDDNLVASSGFCVLRADKCLSEYLMAIVTSDRFTDDMTKVVTGANYPAIKDSDVMGYQVALPPREMQEQFATLVKQVDKSGFMEVFQCISYWGL